MQEALKLAVGLGVGLALGWLHFGALWQTLSALPKARMPGLLMAASLIARMAVLLAGLYFVARWGGWVALAGALVGIVAVRAWLLRRIGGPANGSGRSP